MLLSGRVWGGSESSVEEKLGARESSEGSAGRREAAVRPMREPTPGRPTALTGVFYPCVISSSGMCSPWISFVPVLPTLRMGRRQWKETENMPE